MSFSLDVLGECYSEKTDINELIWTGDLLYFPDPPARDAKCYMFYFDQAEREFRLINWLGYKAGAHLVVASIPNTAQEKGKQAVRLEWFKNNWHETFLPFSSFEQAKFLGWTGTGE